jgi:hypothetical protein
MEQQWSGSVLNAICERAAGLAGLPKKALVEVVPFPVRRIGRTDYQELATRADLENVTSQQLTGFVFAVEQDTKTMLTKELDLAVSRADPGRWDASITFAGLVYSPVAEGQERGHAD